MTALGGLGGWFGLGLIAIAMGLGGLRYAWRHGPARRIPRILAWGALLAAVVLFAKADGFDSGTMTGLSAISVAAYAVVAWGLQLRKARSAKTAAADSLDPPPSSRNPARIAARTLAATVLAMTAALAMSTTYALHGAGSAIDRLASATYMLPFLWGATLAWALSDVNIRRVLIGLTAITALGAALSLLIPATL